MKKIFYLCTILLMSMNMMAQIDPYDNNWDTLFIEDFSRMRDWNNYWDDGGNGYPALWKCFAYEYWHAGTTTDTIKHHQAFRKENAVFSSDQTLKLHGEFVSALSLHCKDNTAGRLYYDPASWNKYCHYCDNIQNEHKAIHYYSGMIETVDTVGYGYFEIQCKMPLHDGTNDSFWLYSNRSGVYEEIDIMEHSTRLCESGLDREISTGVFINLEGNNYVSNNQNSGAKKCGVKRCYIPTNAPALDEYHVFGCEWMPEKVTWYLDGEKVNEYTDVDSIPKHPMWLKVMHVIDQYANLGNRTNPQWWTGDDEMVVNYVKVFALKTSCDEDAFIRSLADLNDFAFSVKHSISMGPLNGTMSIPNNSNFTLRAVDSITLNGEMVIPIGAKMTLIIQDCPRCSLENLDYPNYDCGL